MTTVYGVTRIGARSQIQNKLREANTLDKKEQFRVAEYLSHRVLGGLGEVCIGAGEIMEWFRTCCKIILKIYPHDLIRWTSPLGFPVVQPYRNYRSHRITTCLQEITYCQGDESMPAMVRKQIQGGPANWIHTADGTHMHSTNLRSIDEDITFAEIHDCYMTHSETMDRLGVLLREEFVTLHKDSEAVRLYNEWRDLYPLADIPEPPPRGNFDLDLVLKSPYFFN